MTGMRKKYFFFDIDGTLAPDGTLCVPESTTRCLRALRAAGHFTALATGRLQADAALFAVKHGFDALVADGGHSAAIGGRLLFMDSLPVAACAALADRLDRDGIPWAINTANIFANSPITLIIERQWIRLPFIACTHPQPP